MAKSNADIIQGIIKSVSKTTETELQVLGAVTAETLEVCSTGYADIDFGLLTIGGWPKGRVSECSGTQSSAKSTLLYKTAGICQKSPGNLSESGGIVAIFDIEQVLHGYGAKWAELQGLDLSKVIYSSEICAEKVMWSAINLARQGVDLIIIDSVAGMVASADSVDKAGKKGTDQLSPGYSHLAGVMGNGLKELSKAAKDGNCCVIFVNQIRQKLGVMFGSNETTPGGNALKYFSSVRLRLDKKSDIKESGDNICGVMSKGYVQKSKVSPPLKRTGVGTIGHIPIYFDGRSVDSHDSLIENGIATGIINKVGRTLSFFGISATSKDKFKELIKVNQDALNALEEALRNNKDIVVSEDEMEDLGDGVI
jgi:recombination protein RecA